MARPSPTAAELFWDLVEELRVECPGVEEGTIMGGRCVRVRGEFLALVDFKSSCGAGSPANSAGTTGERAAQSLSQAA